MYHIARSSSLRVFKLTNEIMIQLEVSRNNTDSDVAAVTVTGGGRYHVVTVALFVCGYMKRRQFSFFPSLESLEN
jgi:hypothetical protein